MKNLSYYKEQSAVANEMNAGSAASDEAPLIINCAGHWNAEFPFSTDNKDGRLDYYLMYIVSGTLSVELDDGSYRVSEGDTVVFSPGYRYRYSYDGTGGALSYLWVHFTGSHAKYYLDEAGFDALPCIRCSDYNKAIVGLFNKMFETFSLRGNLYEHVLSSYFLRILVSLSQSKKDNPISRSLAYINASYNENIRIPDLALLENMSNSRYHTVFYEATGTSPKNYITDLRIRHACELLQTTDLSIKQIGVIVGYSDPHFFCKIFKSRVGISPRAYREE